MKKKNWFRERETSSVPWLCDFSLADKPKTVFCRKRSSRRETRCSPNFFRSRTFARFTIYSWYHSYIWLLEPSWTISSKLDGKQVWSKVFFLVISISLIECILFNLTANYTTLYMYKNCSFNKCNYSLSEVSKEFIRVYQSLNN